MPQEFYSKLEKLLKKDSRFVDQEGDLLKSNVIGAAYKADKKLVELMFSQREFKSKFFSKIKDVLVFNINDFVGYIQDKNFLADSYTKYRNKIGLNIDGKFLNERKEVALVWPFKDCVLEGGMTKEDEKRKEIFFNEILAQDEIDKLFDPKVLTNWKRYTRKGEEKVKELKRDKDGTIQENLIIKGNNLLALHSLKQQFQNKVKLIYIDPPYNRDAEVFYNDSFHRSSWLVFMKNRLEIARQLLKEDGLIFIQIDDAQQAYLKVLCDEVFNGNFITSIAVQMSTASGLKISHKEKKILKIKEYLLVYAKNKEITLFDPIYTPKNSWDYGYEFFLEKNNSKRVRDWTIKRLDDVLKENGIKNKDINEPAFKDFYLANRDLIWGRGRHHNIPKEIFELSMKHRDNVFEYGDGGEKNYAYRGRRLAFLTKTINKCLQEDGSYKEDISMLLCDLWSDINTAKLFNEGGIDFPNGKKPEQLLQRIIYLCTDEQDLILDFFLGSGGTAAVAHKTNRQYIGIEQLDYGKNDSVNRLVNVIKNEDPGGITSGVNWKGGCNFVYCELMKYNEQFVEKIQKAKNIKELLKIWEEMKEKSFLNYNVDIKKFNENIDEFKKLPVNKQKHILFEILNKNQLYVNLSEIKDKDFKVSEEDQKLNLGFYK